MLITAGKIIKPHGIRGEVCIESYLDDPSIFCGNVLLRWGQKEPVPYTLESFRPHQGRLLVTFKEVADRNVAETLRNADVLIPRQLLPAPEPGEFYLQDIIGLTVLHSVSFEEIGHITDISLESGQEIWFIESTGGKEIMFPAVPEFVDTIDLDSGTVTILPPEGLLELYT